MNMKLRGTTPGYRHLHEGTGPAPAGMILLLCLYLFGAAAGCYLAKDIAGPVVSMEDWVKLCACADGMAIALALLLPWFHLYPLLPLTMLPVKGMLTSAWVVWQCAAGSGADYLRCWAGYGVYAAGSLLCLLVACLRGFSLRLRPGKRKHRIRAALMLLGILYGFLMMVTLLQTQLCKWL